MLVLGLTLASCQPQVGVVFDVILPEGVAATRPLEVVATATGHLGDVVSPDRVDVARTERGYVVEVAWFETRVDATIDVWLDRDGDGERGPRDLAGTLGQMHLTGGGCSGIQRSARDVRLVEIAEAN